MFARKVWGSASLALVLVAVQADLPAQSPHTQGRERLKEWFDLVKLKQSPGAQENELHKAQLERYSAALVIAEGYFRPPPEAPEAPLPKIFEAAQRVYRAELELTDKSTDHVAILERQLTLARDMETYNHSLMGRVAAMSKADQDMLRYYRANAEVQLLQAKRYTSQSRP